MGQYDEVISDFLPPFCFFLMFGGFVHDYAGQRIACIYSSMMAFFVRTFFYEIEWVVNGL